MKSEETDLPVRGAPEAQSGQDAQRGFWLTHMRIGFGVFLAETVVVMVYLGLTPDSPHRTLEWFVVSLWLVAALAGIGMAPAVDSKPWGAACLGGGVGLLVF